MTRLILCGVFAPIISIGAFVFATPSVHASEESLETVISTSFDAETLAKGYTLSSDDGMMRLGIRPMTLTASTRVDVKTLDSSLMEGTYPSDRERLGNVYLFDIINKESYAGSDFFFLEIQYRAATSQNSSMMQGEDTLHGARRIYFYNGVSGAWESLPSEDHTDIGSVRALIHLPYARLAIFEEPIPEYGKASWYAYKGCDCAASPDYAKGTRLVVSRADDPTKNVIVRVNDWGPDRAVHPDRIIDLDSVAFKKLARLGAGVIDVQVKFLP
jgi:hypothetical protein